MRYVNIKYIRKSYIIELMMTTAAHWSAVFLLLYGKFVVVINVYLPRIYALISDN